ncbi:hypothetical protein Pmani_037862 [Petrolisthes manimaculis]|uniref:Uncharacterized protein n=1 Tax=Petrolisthes manimaculis TaxID=1843537 RepID=A0AAE1NHD2_9EUCA|nr:hypothetical protein Pmani_037862 [Petrolisthes manimaculis]
MAACILRDLENDLDWSPLKENTGVNQDKYGVQPRTLLSNQGGLAGPAVGSKAIDQDHPPTKPPTTKHQSHHTTSQPNTNHTTQHPNQTPTTPHNIPTKHRPHHTTSQPNTDHITQHPNQTPTTSHNIPTKHRPHHTTSQPNTDHITQHPNQTLTTSHNIPTKHRPHHTTSPSNQVPILNKNTSISSFHIIIFTFLFYGCIWCCDSWLWRLGLPVKLR